MPQEEDNYNRDDEGGGGEEGSEASLTKNKSAKKRRDTLRKAPQAPKRFKSSYICFFMAKQPEIKESLGDKATVSEVSKRSAEMWKCLSAEDRAYWDTVAAKDKERYMVEKASYTGPWQVPWKRAKKDPSAPKRPMSAFLYFSQGRRTLLKQQHSDMKNTEISRLLGNMWRNASDAEKRPFVEKEKEEREKYKVAIAEWKKRADIRQAVQKQAAAEWPVESPPHQTVVPPNSGEPPGSIMPGVAPYPRDHAFPHHHPHYMYPPHPYPYGFPPGPYSFPPPPGVAGKQQPVILGPHGVPHYGPMPGSGYVMDPSQGYPPDEGLVGPEPAMPYDYGDSL